MTETPVTDAILEAKYTRDLASLSEADRRRILDLVEKAKAPKVEPELELVTARPGAKTSEFWMTAISAVSGLGLLIFGAVSAPPALAATFVMAGAGLLGIPIPFYTASRAKAKAAKP